METTNKNFKHVLLTLGVSTFISAMTMPMAIAGNGGTTDPDQSSCQSTPSTQHVEEMNSQDTSDSAPADNQAADNN